MFDNRRREQSQYGPHPREFSLRELLAGWGESIGAAAVLLARLPRTIPPRAECTRECPLVERPYVCATVQEGCPAQTKGIGQVIESLGPLPPPGSVCVRCRLSSGDALVLQVALPAPPVPLDTWVTYVPMLAAPVLFLACEMLDGPSRGSDLRQRLQTAPYMVLLAMHALEYERERLAVEIKERVAQTLAAIFSEERATASYAKQLA